MAQIRLYLDEADGDLPNACMCCGEEATVTKTKKMQWTPPWVGILILLGLLPYVIAAMILTKRARLEAPFCDQHKGHWLNRTLLVVGSALVLGLISALSFVPLAFLPQPRNDGFFGFACLGSVVLFIVWIIILVVAQNSAIRCKEITEDEMVLDGVSRDFVEIVEDQRDNRRARRRKAKGRDDDDEDEDRPRRKAKRRDDEDDADPEDRPRRKRPPSDAIEE